jgi:hypothetical protein
VVSGFKPASQAAGPGKKRKVGTGWILGRRKRQGNLHFEIEHREDLPYMHDQFMREQSLVLCGAGG